MKYHKTVLLEEAIKNLIIKPKGTYVDCTLGEGGHSIEILKHLDDDGLLISIDSDLEAIEFIKTYYKKTREQNKNWIIKRENFKNIKKLLEVLGISKVDGILMDLGLSSRQLEASERGFSYLEGSQDLDMRMDTELNAKAIDLLRFYDEKTLAKIIKQFGEEKNAKKIAKLIKKKIEDIETVEDLNNIILGAVPAAHQDKSKHPSRRVFQALRIAVNNELDNLETGLKESYNLLKKGGIIAVISFHSLEDRIAKNFCVSKGEHDLILPSEKETRINLRARSAKMRILKK